VDLQIGLEPSPFTYIETLTALFREVRRVLRDDGTLWLNLADSYSTSGNGGGGKNTNRGTLTASPRKAPQGFKPKDLLGIPWRTAIALQEDGWYLRQDIIWSKPNPMPESVTDRCTKAHEYIFLLSKCADYYFDFQALQERESHSYKDGKPSSGKNYSEESGRKDGSPHINGRGFGDASGLRRRRSVWTIPIQPYRGAHFAAFPRALVQPMILAGCPEGGVVLDPFGGSGTTGEAAMGNGRKAILIELNPKYLPLIKQRGGMFCNLHP
jgi:DNA modification methylase